MSKEMAPEAQVKAALGVSETESHMHYKGPREEPPASENSLSLTFVLRLKFLY